MSILYADAQPQVLLIQLIGEHENETLDDETSAIRKAVCAPFVFVGVPVRDWEKELMPWADPFVSKDAEVGLHAGETLNYLTESLIPYLRNEYGSLPIILGGYSLAGLFALWAATQSDLFAAVAACSPSLWVNSWNEYAALHPVRTRKVYLSLGDKEEKTRNRRLAVVGDCVRTEYDLLRQQLGADQCTLVMEHGGHFVTPHLRLARGFAWCLSKLKNNPVTSEI